MYPHNPYFFSFFLSFFVFFFNDTATTEIYTLSLHDALPILLLRDILFFEADEDNEPHIYIAPGVMPHWLGDGKSISVSDAPTVFGSLFGYKLTHNQAARSVEIQILQPPPSHVSFIYPCRFGSGVSSVTADGSSLAITGNDVKLPANTTQATVRYL